MDTRNMDLTITKSDNHELNYKQNEHWHQPSLEQYSPLPASTQFHEHYYSAEHKLILLALLQGIRDGRLDKKM